MWMYLLGLEVLLVADEEGGDFIVGVGLGLVEPLADVVKGLAVGDVVDEDDTDGSSVVGPGDGLEGFLSGLDDERGTVSQICSLMGLPPTWMILDPNSTPMVVSWSNLNFFYKNWRSMQLLPTPKLSG